MAKNKNYDSFEFVGRVLHILEILQKSTDEHTTITQSEILEKLKKDEYSCSERTLTDYLKAIMLELNPEDKDGFVEEKKTISDYKIIPKGLEDKLHARDIGLTKEGSKKLQLRSLRYNHLFSIKELNQVIEAILFMKNIGTETKKELIKKLLTLSSENFARYSPFISETTGKISTSISGVYEDSRIDEATVRENLNIIRKAIEANCKISFHFNSYNKEKKLVLRTNLSGKPIIYVASPYYVILYNGKYYLVCNVEPYDNAAFYRIDLMSDISNKMKISVLDKKTKISEKRKPKQDIKGLPCEWNDKSAFQFQTEHMNMFYGEPYKIRLKINRDRYTLLHDYFGDKYEFIQHLDDCWDEVEVKCVPKAMESWAMQCSEYVEVLSPEEVRIGIIERCRELLGRYEN